MNKISNGVYIFHETLGVKTVEGWNPKDNEGVIGVLVVEDDHKIVVALEDAPKKLEWVTQNCFWPYLFDQVVNRLIEDIDDAETDFNGEEYCKNLNSPGFPASYYCLNYKKGGLDWYLPSSGELWMIHRYNEEIQTALSIVGGQKFVTTWEGKFRPWYCSSTEALDSGVWFLGFFNDEFYKFPCLQCGDNKIATFYIRPVSKFIKI